MVSMVAASVVSALMKAGASGECLSSPALRLDASFEAVLTDEVMFQAGCEDGFTAYFVGRSVPRRYTWAEVVRYVAHSVLSSDEEGAALPLAWNAGFTLGWLSGLAVADRVLAVRAVGLLEKLVRWVWEHAQEVRA